MSDPLRYLVASGEHTAIRVALGKIGVVRVGSGRENDLIITDDEVAQTHVELFLEPELGARALAEDTAVISADGATERVLAVGTTTDLAPGERVRAGPVELGVSEGLPVTAAPRAFGERVLRARIDAAIAAREAGFVIRAPSREGALQAALEHASARDLVAELDDGELGVLIMSAREPDTRAWAAALGVEVGVAELEGDANDVLARASDAAGPSESSSEGAVSEETVDSDGMSLRDEMALLERRRIQEALEKYPTQTEAAKALGVPLRTFLNRLDALGIARARKK